MPLALPIPGPAGPTGSTGPAGSVGATGPAGSSGEPSYPYPGDSSAAFLTPIPIVIHVNRTLVNQTLSGGVIYPSGDVPPGANSATLQVDVVDPFEPAWPGHLTTGTSGSGWTTYLAVTMALAGGTAKTIPPGHVVTLLIDKNADGVQLPPFLLALSIT